MTGAGLHPAAEAAALARRRRRATGPPPAADGAQDRLEDSGRIMVLIGVFTVATLTVVGALLGAAAIDTWWALGAALGVHLAMTVTAFCGVFFVLVGHLPTPPGHRHPD